MSCPQRPGVPPCVRSIFPKKRRRLVLQHKRAMSEIGHDVSPFVLIFRHMVVSYWSPHTACDHQCSNLHRVRGVIGHLSKHDMTTIAVVYIAPGRSYLRAGVVPTVIISCCNPIRSATFHKLRGNYNGLAHEIIRTRSLLTTTPLIG